MMKLPRRLIVPAAVSALLLLASTGFDSPVAFARSVPPPDAWPPSWQDTPSADFSPVAFAAPSANHCHRLPTTREVAGGGRGQDERESDSTGGKRGRMDGPMTEGSAESKSSADKKAAMSREASAPPAPAAVAPMPSHSPKPQAVPSARQPNLAAAVTAGVVDDNADFGEYLAYRDRRAQGLEVRQRDVSERYPLDVVDAAGRPVHDAEVAIQRVGVAEPVAWARTDTAGRVWIHPKAFLAPEFANEQRLGIAVRKNGVQSRAMLVRGQKQAVQVQLDRAAAVARPRLDLVFMIDATGSMGDEIAKLKASMHAMSQQIAQLPGRPDICYGLVAYRDRGDAFLTRTHDFTDNLGAFQGVLAKVQAGGGGDTPEALNEALHETVHGLAWRTDAVRLAVMVADAPPHLDYGGPQYDRDMQAALAKGVKLFAVGASGLDPAGEYVFRQMAQYTAGRFVFLTYRDGADPSSGPGGETVHDVRQYSVQTLDRLVVRLVGDELAKLPRG